MLEILQNLIGILTADATLTSIVPANNIFTGPVDVVMQKQADLLYPQINLHIISEAQRSNPLGARDTQVGIEIFSRNSQLELENIYERIVTLLSYETADQDTAHIFWTRLGGAVDIIETDRRFWHRAVTYSAWALKPN
jgi:hypothetical protein